MDTPTYTHIQCPTCGRERTVPSWTMVGMFKEHGVKVEVWDYAWFGARMRCSRCGTKGMVVRGQ